MKVLALEKEIPGVSDARFTPDLLRAEAAAAWELHQAGLVRELYFHSGPHEAVLMLECSGAEEAHAILGRLPLVREGLIDFAILPLEPYDGFARLFVK